MLFGRRLADLLQFSPHTYYRQFEFYNEAIWPGQILALAAGLAIAWMLWRPTPARTRIAALLLALAWAFTAWQYLHTRHAVINWISPYYGIAFAVEAALLVLIGTLGGRLTVRREMNVTRGVGLAMFLAALLLLPLTGLPQGRPLVQAEIFGLAPDPTVIATLGFLLAADRMRWLLLPLPLAWCIITGTTLWLMHAPEAAIAPAVAALVLLLATRRALAKPHRNHT
jgi:hypothetical protein